jgi:hypothetical protein
MDGHVRDFRRPWLCACGWPTHGDLTSILDAELAALEAMSAPTIPMQRRRTVNGGRWEH